jgi:hypothetical protein
LQTTHPPGAGNLKPIITIYSRGAEGEPKKFEGFMEASFWIGVDHAEGDLVSVKVRQPAQAYDEEVSTLGEFTDLLVRRQINFSIEFFSEPQPLEAASPTRETTAEQREEESPLVLTQRNDFQSEIEQLRDEYKRGSMTKKQYKMRKEELLKQWKEKVEDRLGS